MQLELKIIEQNNRNLDYMKAMRKTFIYNLSFYFLKKYKILLQFCYRCGILFLRLRKWLKIKFKEEIK